MFLKRIELTGFKSFANKTELEFVKGISAVVGPNGSGKSNISDGIRWVLGEQSARSLRGGKMEDVIFAGSDSRRAVNFAEVSLTLDNIEQKLPLDFSEITVTRRLHRSGESEYFINKQACRLRDIHELFMDTGIGREAYSIIGQGRIEEILSTRSEDRRGIFEEASGIVKFKARKREAEKKLEQTEQNLLRIYDLISELEDQIEPLREQSEKATAYKQLREQLKSNEISLYVHQIEQVHAAWQEASEISEALKQEQLHLATIVNQHDAELEAHRLMSRQLEQQLEQLQEQLLTTSAQLEKCEGQGDVLQERGHHLQQNREERARLVQQGEARLAELQAERADIAAKHEELTQVLRERQQQLAAEQERLTAIISGTLSEVEEQLKAELLDVLNEMAQARNELRYVEQQNETLERRELKLDEDQAKWLEQKEALRKQKSDIEQRLIRIGEEIDTIRDHYLAQNEQYKTKQALLDEASLMLRRTEQQRDALISRRDTMQEMLDDYDGFVHGVRAVLKSRQQASGLKGVHGAVAELVKVPAKFEVAIETALGGALQNIVMDDEQASRVAINYLKEKRLGRATFLPLDVMRARTINESEKSEMMNTAGFVGIAVDLVQYEERYRPIFSHLLGHVVIAETLEQANRIAAKGKYRYRVVTLDGDIVHAGGSMSGGSQHRKNVSLLGRQRQIEQMTAHIAKADDEVAKLKEQMEELRSQLADIAEELEQLRGQGEEKRLQEQQVRSELERVEHDGRGIEGQLQLYALDAEALAEEKQQHVARAQQLEQQLVDLAAKEASLQAAIEQAESDRKSQLSAKDELQAQLTELKIKEATILQEKQATEHQLQRNEAELNAVQQQYEADVATLEQLEQDIVRNEEERVEQVRLLNEISIQRDQCAEQIEFKRAERAEWISKLESEEQETREQRNDLKKVESELHQTEVKVNRLDVELDNLLRNLAEDYELSYELAKQRYPKPEDVASTQRVVKELKQQIAALGEVNIGAIDEYERVSERYTFLNEQKSDLTEAKQTLYKVIAEMEQEMSKLFQTTFEQIREHFAIVFAKLFGGGQADLILSEPDELLETGIEIVAQPPGKKLQNLQLLSGGERALTAIALLFAILHVKPVPFCVLDEVEAALDESNVVRFGQYLKEFAEDTQFIVVTHRKGTMEAADVLYGVTMEEDGVSKLVSVRLDDDGSAVSA